MTGVHRWAFFVRRHDPVSAELVKVLLDRLPRTDGVRQLEWYEAREVPQPEDVSRSLNAVHGLGTVDFDDPGTAERIAEAVAEIEGAVQDPLVRGIFTTSVPEYDLLRDTPPRHIPYLHLPIEWHSTRAVPEEPTGVDLWRYVYFFRYKPEVTWDSGEEWYVGHHTREGKQLPGLRRYETWARAMAFGQPGPLNGSARYTELCFTSFADWYRACYSHGPRWRMSPEHPKGVWEDYHAFFVGPDPTFTARTDD